MARKQPAERLDECRRRHDEEERRQRVIIITEFSIGSEDPEATMHAMAGAILEYRRVLGMLGRAVDLAKVGAPFGLFPPGPLWRPRRTSESDVVPPAA
jgi:hypothetical protein